VAKKAKASAPPKERNWTFMVYMAAEQSRDLDSVAVRDLREMERGCRDNDNINVVVMLDRHWPGAQMYEVTGKGSRLIRQFPGRTNMGDGKTLKKFLTTVAKSPKYRATNYCLILWGHAFGLGFGRDHDDPLVLPELKKALTRFREVRKYRRPKTDGRLEILGTNSCSMSYLEAAFELRESADLMIASQITVPFAGWPYDVIFQRMRHSAKPDFLSKLVVDAYVTQFDDLPGGDRLAMTVLNLVAARGLDKALEELAQAIDAEIVSSGFNSKTLAYLRDLFMGSAAGDVRPLIDLTTLLRSLAPEKDPLSEKIAVKARTLLDLLHVKTKHRPRLVECCGAHPDLRDDLLGIGIYAPFVTDKGIVGRLGLSDAPERHGPKAVLNGKQQYERLDIFPRREKAAWPRLVYEGLRRTIPADLIFAIDGISELQSGDRADVAQIIMSIEASLNQFDRAVEKAKDGIKFALVGSKPNGSKPNGSKPKTIKFTRSGPPASFSAAWLRLITPVSPDAIAEPQPFKRAVASARYQAQVYAVAASKPTPTVSTIVENLIAVENALSQVEKVTRRGLIHARFGLGLLSPAPSGFGQEPPKSGDGQEPPKSGDGQEPPKSGDGQEPPKSGDGLPGSIPAAGDLRVDRGLQRVAGLFGEVGRAMQDLEQALADTEHVARASLVVSPAPTQTFEAAAMQLRAKFLVLEDASARARRTIRRALVHPIYGLGPSEGQLTFDVRQDLASRGGLDRRRLKLL
jgi:hypothetical protein